MLKRRTMTWVAVFAAVCLIVQVCSSIPRAAAAPSATKLAFTTAAAGAVAATNFTTQPVVTIEDSSGNAVTSSTASVTLSISGGAAGATLSCTTNPVTATSGVATFAGCKIDKSSTTAYTLTATSSGLTQATASLTVSPGTASKIVFTTTATGGQGGVAWTTQPVVTIEDAASNTVTSNTAKIAMALGAGGNGATLTCPAVNAVAGVATFAGCSIDKGPGTYTLVATDGSDQLQASNAGVTVTSNTLPATVAFSTQPTSGISGTALPVQPVITVKDAGGNGVVASVTLSLTGGATGAHLSCTANPVTSSAGGVATFSGCQADKAEMGYSLTATVGGLSAASSAFAISPGSPHQLVFTSLPGGGSGGVAWASQPTVVVEDAAGNRVVADAAPISLAITAGTGATGATLACVANPVTASGGTAAFAGCEIDRATVTTYTVTATDTTDVLSAVSQPPFTIAVGPPTQLAFLTQPSGAGPNAAFTTQPVVAVLDAGGNTVASSTLATTLTIGPGTGTAGAALSCTTNPTTANAGLATFAACKINTASTGYVLHAAASGVAGANSTSFSVATAPAMTTATLPTVALGQTFGGLTYGANPTLVTNNVNSATGALVLDTSDLNVAGVGTPFNLTRSYDSADRTGGSFGPGWTSLFDAGVTIAASGKTATVRGEDGQQLIFTSNGAGGWVAPPGARSTLTCSGQNCTVTKFDASSWHSAAGKIQDYLAPTGQGLHFSYTNNLLSAVTVLTNSGPPLTIAVTTNATGQVTKVTTPTRSTAYGYTNGLLTSFTDATGNVWTYAYDASGRLTTQTDPLGQVRQTVTYDANGRVTSSVTAGDPSSQDVTFSWNPTTQTETRSPLLDVNGVPTRVAYQDVYRGNVLISQRQPDGGEVDYGYDATLHLIQVKDPLGWVQQSTYNASGDLITQTAPTSATGSAVSRKTYDSEHQVLSATDPDGNTTTFAYSGTNLVKMTPPGGASTTYTYDGFGEALTETTPTGSRTFHYDRFGNVTSRQEFSPSGQSLNGAGDFSAYDEAGDQVESVDPRGVVAGQAPNPAYTSTQTYSPTGLLLTKTDPTGKITSYTYNKAGTLVSVTNPAGAATTYSWNQATRTLTTANASGSTSQTYDAAGNVIAATDASGAVTTTLYNNMGLKVSETDPTKVTYSYTYDLALELVSSSDTTGNTSTSVYDPLGRVTATTTNGRTTTSTYDAAGNVLSSRTPDGVVTSYTYDSQNRVASATNPTGKTSYTYDGDSNLTRVTDANGHVTNYAFDGADRPIAKIVNGATWTYGYDAAGNLISSTDPDGRTTTYDVNAADLVTGVHYRWAGHTPIDVSYTYDSLNRVSTMTDPTGSHSYTYTASNALASVTSGADVFSYDYSTPGQRVVTYPDGTKVTYVTDDGGNLMSVTAGQPGQSDYASASYVRNPARQAVSIAYSNGIVTSQTFDVRGDIVDQNLQLRGATVADTAYTYDGAGNPVSIATTLGGTTSTQSYGYDALGRLTAVGSASQAAPTPTVPPAPVTPPTMPATPAVPSGTPSFPAPVAGPAPGPGPQPPAGSPSYTYDGAGNRLTATTASGTTTYKYNAADEITSESGPGGSTTWTYDKSGNVTSTTGPTGSTTYGYDASGRVSSTVVTPAAGSPGAGSATTSTYTYDGDGNRVTKTVNGVTTQYLWDISADVPLLAIERTSTGTLIRRYIYGDGPVAMETPTATYFYHVNPTTGSVTQLTDANGNIVASYSYDGYGNVTTTPSTGAPANPLLFQGQYLDAETGLYNMGARLYDPTTGRFTQRDSVNTSPGDPAMSPYLFVNDRPTILVDPSGRDGTFFQPYTYTRQAATTPTLENTFGDSSSTASISASDANAVFDTKLAVTGAAGGVTSARLIGTYSSDTLKALVEVKVVEWVPLESGGFKAAGEVTEVGKYAAAAKGVALGLAAVAFAFSVVIAVVDCDNAVNSPENKEANIALCAGDVVGLAFMVGCTAAGSVLGLSIAAGVACNLAGGVLSYIIGAYGPQIYDGLSVGAQDLAAFTTGVVAPYFKNVVGPALENFFVQSVYGGLVSGLNQLNSYLSSGYLAVMQLLASVGYNPIELGKLAVTLFLTGISDAISLMGDLGFPVVAIGQMLASFSQTAQQAAALLSAAFDYTVDQIGSVLDSVYAEADSVTSAILSGLNYGITEISDVLHDIYTDPAGTAAAVLQGLNYAADQIGSALDNVFSQTAAQVTADLNGLFDFSAIGGVLDDIYSQTAQQAAALLQGINAGVGDITSFLQSGYGLAAAGAASILKGLGFSAADIESELTSLYGSAASDIANILSSIGFSNATIDALGSAFSSFGQSVSNCFTSFFSDC